MHQKTGDEKVDKRKSDGEDQTATSVQEKEEHKKDSGNRQDSNIGGSPQEKNTDRNGGVNQRQVTTTHFILIRLFCYLNDLL